MKKAQMYNIL